MKSLALGLVATGALVVATAVPALAQVDVYTGPGGVGVQVGPRGHYHGGPRYYDQESGWRAGHRVYDRHRHYDHDED